MSHEGQFQQTLKQTIDNDDAQSALAILNQNRPLLNQYCVLIHFDYPRAVQLTNNTMLPICLTKITSWYVFDGNTQ